MREALRWGRRGAMLLLLLAVLEYLVLPQIAGTRQAVHLLGGIRPGWVIVGVLLELASLVSYSLLTRSVLPDETPRFSWLIRTDITALGVSHVLPGGAATASTLRYRLLNQGGAPAQDAAVGMAVEGVGSTLVLAVMLWLALVVSLPLLGLHPVYLTAAAVGAVVIAAAVIAVLVHRRSTEPASQWMSALVRRLPRRIQPRVARAVDGADAQVHQLLADKQGLRASAMYAAGSWALDAASLWVFLAAYGHRVNPDGLFVAYALANLLAVLPISPGGIGLIEGVLIPSIVGLGSPRGIAVLGVVSWRLFNFWAPIPASGICYLSLRVQQWRDDDDVGDGEANDVPTPRSDEAADSHAADRQVPQPESVVASRASRGRLRRSS
jgi:putative heme transporter